MQPQTISMPIHEIRIERNVPVTMRDGTIWRAAVYWPQEEGRYPVVVERVAYELTRRCQYNGEFFARRGYVFVGQNVRGRYASEGKFNVFQDDAWGANQDGYDTVEWAGTQSWSNVTVSMVGGSNSRFSQHLLMATRTPHLNALVVHQGGPDPYQDFIYHNV